MCRRRRIRGFAALALFLTCIGIALQAQSQQRLWVLSEPDSIVEYDPGTFSPKPAIKVPREAVRNPVSFAVNKRGWMLFAPRMGASGDRIWLWKGREATVIDRAVTLASVPAGDKRLLTEIFPGCYPSRDSPQLYWFENRFRKLVATDSQIESSVTTTFRAWHTDLSGGGREQIATLSFAPCECATGVCEETCPQAGVWVPEEGLADFFIVTVFVPGQLQTDYQSTRIYVRKDGRWTENRRLQAMEQVLDAAGGGNLIVHAVLDGGCCGWDNESNDKTIIWRDGEDSDLFDERARYGNLNYDVSFFTSNARLSPGAQFVAITITATARAGAEIRLSSEGRENPAELERIRRAIAELPAVEVLRLEGAPSRSIYVPRATLVGWLNEDEVLLVQDNLLVAVSTSTGVRRMSQVRVPDAARVFVR